MTASDSLFAVSDLLPEGAFTEGIEGPAVAAGGSLYAVNYVREGTVGRITPGGEAEIFVTLPEGSTGNGIRVAADGALLVADYTRHNVLRVDPVTRAVTVYAHEPRMNQPNDLALDDRGRLYASDPSWADSTGQLWRIDPDGSVTLLADGLGTTNGVEVSPDGRTLYVNESVQRTVWAYPLSEAGTLGGRRPLVRFDDHGLDGMRSDASGTLYVTRYGKGTVALVSPAGEVRREVRLQGLRPTNLAFGGPDGRTVYVTVADRGTVEVFRTDQPGRSYRPSGGAGN